MRGYAGTTQTVDAIGRLGLTGNIIPRPWYQWLKFDNGKPNAVAIAILSELCYWYRPLEELDEKTGRVIGWRKRFKADLLQKSYQDLADCLGFTKRQISDNAHWLEKKGLIKIVRRHFRFASNVVFFDLVPAEIERISFSIPDKSDVTLEREMGHVETEDGLTLERDTYTEITNRDYTENTKEETSVSCETLRSPSLSQNDSDVSSGRKTGSDRKSMPPSSRSKSANGKNKTAKQDQKRPAKLPRKKILSYDENGWLQLPGHSHYAVPTKLAIRRMQIVLSFDWLDYIDIDRRDRGKPYFINDKGSEGYENEFYAADGKQSLLALRTFAYTQSGMPQDWFNDFLELLFRDSINYCNKAGLSRAEDVIGQGRVFDEFIDAENLEVA